MEIIIDIGILSFISNRNKKSINAIMKAKGWISVPIFRPMNGKKHSNVRMLSRFKSHTSS